MLLVMTFRDLGVRQDGMAREASPVARVTHVISNVLPPITVHPIRLVIKTMVHVWTSRDLGVQLDGGVLVAKPDTSAIRLALLNNIVIVHRHVTMLWEHARMFLAIGVRMVGSVQMLKDNLHVH